MTRQLNSLLCISILITLILCTTAFAKVPQKSLHWAERLLATANLPLTKCDNPYMHDWDAMNAEDAYKQVIHKYGMDTRLYAGLADSQMLLGKYKDAVKNYQSALKLSQKNKSLKIKLDLAIQSDYMSKLVLSSLQKNHKVVRILRISDSSGIVWLVLSAIRNKGYNGNDDIRLTVFRVISNQPVLLWQSEKLCYSSPDLTEASSVQLTLEDITGDKEPEIIVPTSFSGVSWTPSHIAIFRWQNGKMHKLLGVRSDTPLVISDLDHNGRYEVIGEHCIGSSMGHAGMPSWKDIYEYKNGIFQLADGDFPNQYRDLAIKIRQKLRKYPSDWSLFKYQGIIHQIQHNSSRALHSLKRALRTCKASLKNETDKEYRSYLAYNIQDIEHRIDRIKR